MKKGTIRPRDAEQFGIDRKHLYQLYHDGRLVRVARGVYALPDWEPAEHVTLAEASARVPNGVICLLSALRFHELTTQLPHEVWIAIRRGDWKPNVPELPLRLSIIQDNPLKWVSKSKL